MPAKTRGYADAFHQSRINHIAGTAYPAPITTPYIGFYLGSLPLSDGSGATDNVRVAVSWTAPAQDVNGRWYIQPTGPVTFTPTANGECVGWGVYSAASGGVPAFVDVVPSRFRAVAGVAVTLPAQSLRVFAEGAQ